MPSRLYTVPSLERSLLIGGFGFGMASLCVFATVAFAERWMYHHLGLAGAYTAWMVLFIGLGGGVLSLLIARPMRILTFYAIFSAAFFLYAIGWVGAYFTLRGATGEWVGSLAGSVLMSLMIATGFRVMRFLPDGDADFYTGYDHTTHAFAADEDDASVLVLTKASPIS